MDWKDNVYDAFQREHPELCPQKTATGAYIEMTEKDMPDFLYRNGRVDVEALQDMYRRMVTLEQIVKRLMTADILSDLKHGKLTEEQSQHSDETESLNEDLDILREKNKILLRQIEIMANDRRLGALVRALPSGGYIQWSLAGCDVSCHGHTIRKETISEAVEEWQKLYGLKPEIPDYMTCAIGERIQFTCETRQYTPGTKYLYIPVSSATNMENRKFLVLEVMGNDMLLTMTLERVS